MTSETFRRWIIINLWYYFASGNYGNKNLKKKLRFWRISLTTRGVKSDKKGNSLKQEKPIEMKYIKVIALALYVLRTIYANIRCVRHSANKQMKKGGKTAACVCLSGYELWRSYRLCRLFFVSFWAPGLWLHKHASFIESRGIVWQGSNIYI